MTPTPDDLLQPFAQAASAAHMAEAAHAKEFEAELARRKRAREFAFRRLNLIRALAEPAAAAGSGEVAVAGVLAALRLELGWFDDSPYKARILEAFRPVAEAMRLNLCPAEGQPCPPLLEAFAAFETWHQKETGTPFLALLDHEIPEMPLVDF